MSATETMANGRERKPQSTVYLRWGVIILLQLGLIALPLVERLLFSLLFCLIHSLYLISLLYRYLLGGRYPHTAVPPAYAAAGSLLSRRAVSAFSCRSGGRFCSYRAQHIVSLRLLSEVRSC